LAVLLGVLACTLFPFDFCSSNHSFHSVWEVLVIRIGPDRSNDIVENVLLYLPLGFALTGYLDSKEVNPLAAVTAVVVLSIAVSYTIEILQLFIPGRFSSLTDVLSNAAGGSLGFLCYGLAEPRPHN